MNCTLFNNGRDEVKEEKKMHLVFLLSEARLKKTSTIQKSPFSYKGTVPRLNAQTCAA